MPRPEFTTLRQERRFPLYGLGCFALLGLPFTLILAIVGMLQGGAKGFAALLAAGTVAPLFTAFIFVLSWPLVAWMRRKQAAGATLLKELAGRVGGELYEPDWLVAGRPRLWCEVAGVPFEVILYAGGGRRRRDLGNVTTQIIRKKIVANVETEHARMTPGPRVMLDILGGVATPFMMVVMARSRIAGKWSRYPEVTTGDSAFDEGIAVRSEAPEAAARLLADGEFRDELSALITVNGAYVNHIHFRAAPLAHQPGVYQSMELRPEVTAERLSEHLEALVRLARDPRWHGASDV